ncbi:MAG: hypothetical protein LBK68_06440 [Candidatus Margulisbacteria bacterium]|nr:hypothetical protein [Candidatus Margulisiibacteriota bacterium]
MLLKFIADQEKLEQITAAEHPFFDQITELVKNGLAAEEKTNYVEADKYFAQALTVFAELSQLDLAMQKDLFKDQSFYKVHDHILELHQLLASRAVDVAEKLSDMSKIIKYCSIAQECCEQGVAISLDILLKRGLAYLIVGETEKGWADITEYKEWSVAYGASGEQIAAQEQIEELMQLLWDYYSQYFFDENITNNIWQCLQKLARIWEMLE